MKHSLRAFGLIVLMIMAPLAGCFGQAEENEMQNTGVRKINFLPAGEAEMRADEWHIFPLEGE